MVSVKKLIYEAIVEDMYYFSDFLGANIARLDNLSEDGNSSYKNFELYNSFYDWSDHFVCRWDGKTTETIEDSLNEEVLLYVEDNVYDKLSTADKNAIVKAWTKTHKITDPRLMHACMDWEDFEKVKTPLDRAVYSILVEVFDNECETLMTRLYKKYRPVMKRAYKAERD